MNYSELMDIFNSGENLLEETARLFFFDSGILHDMVEKLPAICVFHDKEEFLGGFDNFVELNDMRVAELFENLNFFRNPLDIGLFLNLVLLEYFDSNLKNSSF
jgi:hypothetical protein